MVDIPYSNGQDTRSLFEACEVEKEVPKSEYKKRLSEIRPALIELQSEVLKAGGRVVLLFAGVDGAGKVETANLLSAWMDPRLIRTHSFSDPGPEAAERPRSWKFWVAMPPKGHMAAMLSAWYHDPLLSAVYEPHDRSGLEKELKHIRTFEEVLADDGVLLLKFWMHLSKTAQRKRLESLESDPLNRWRVNGDAWRNWVRYADFEEVAERIIHDTNRPNAPWLVIDGAHRKRRILTVCGTLLDEAHAYLKRGRAVRSDRHTVDTYLESEFKAVRPRRSSKLDFGTQLEDKAEYNRRLDEGKARLHLVYRSAREQRRSIVIVFEGWDAAGKGGCIRRLTEAFDAPDYEIIQIAAPTEIEKGHHYLWRFWTKLPRAGKIAIFDRSWYGRVLVERVEGFATEDEWQRAYSEIAYFERELTESGIILVKLWLDISREEQEQRFKDRADRAHKSWKLTDEDWRNREKWDQYEEAITDMLRKTSSVTSPWEVIDGNDKRSARVAVIDKVADAIELALGEHPTAGRSSLGS